MASSPKKPKPPTLAQLYDLLGGHHPATRFGDVGWQPQADVVVTAERAWIHLEVAGVRGDALELRVRGCTLEVRGRRIAPRLETGANYVRSEIVFGAFVRRLELPWTIDAARLDYSYRDGILECALVRAGAAAAEGDAETTSERESDDE